MTRLDSEPIPGRPLCTADEHQLSPLAAMSQDCNRRHFWPALTTQLREGSPQ